MRTRVGQPKTRNSLAFGRFFNQPLDIPQFLEYLELNYPHYKENLIIQNPNSIKTVKYGYGIFTKPTTKITRIPLLIERKRLLEELTINFIKETIKKYM